MDSVDLSSDYVKLMNKRITATIRKAIMKHYTPSGLETLVSNYGFKLVLGEDGPHMDFSTSHMSIGDQWLHNFLDEWEKTHE